MDIPSSLSMSYSDRWPSVTWQSVTGPSSSHTAGPCKIGLYVAKLFPQAIKYAKITLYSSFAETGRGHGTDNAIVAGLLGIQPDDSKLHSSHKLAKESGLEFQIIFDSDPEHNPLRGESCVVAIEIFAQDGQTMKVTGVSVGGGAIVITHVDGERVAINNSYKNTLVLFRDKTNTLPYETSLMHLREYLRSSDVNVGTGIVSIASPQYITPDVIDRITAYKGIDRYVLLTA